MADHEREYDYLREVVEASNVQVSHVEILFERRERCSTNEEFIEYESLITIVKGESKHD